MSSEEARLRSDSGEPSVPTETLDFLFEYTREAPQRQLEAVDALDNKAFALFSVSAVVVGLAGIGIWNKQELPPGAGVLLSVAVAAFLVVGAMVLYSSWLRRHRLSFQADELWERYWDEPISEIKSALVADIAAAYAHNRQILETKARALRGALIAAIAEIALVGATLAWSSLA